MPYRGLVDSCESFSSLHGPKLLTVPKRNWPAFHVYALLRLHFPLERVLKLRNGLQASLRGCLAVSFIASVDPSPYIPIVTHTSNRVRDQVS